MFLHKVRSFLRLTNGEILIVGAVTVLLLSGSIAAHAYAGNARTSISKLVTTPTATPTTTPSATPSVTPSSTPSPTAASTATPKPAEKTGGQNSPAGSATAPFQIASVMFGAKAVICNDNNVEIVFRDLIVTRHYTTTAGGTADVIIDFSDGKSNPSIPARFPNGGGGTSTLSGIQHNYFIAEYPIDLDQLKYRVRVTSPNAVTKDWWPVSFDHPTIDPSCSLE